MESCRATCCLDDLLEATVILSCLSQAKLSSKMLYASEAFQEGDDVLGRVRHAVPRPPDEVLASIGHGHRACG